MPKTQKLTRTIDPSTYGVGCQLRKPIKVSATLRTLERDLFDGVSRCVGPCKCRVEPDGSCPKGYPSRFWVLVG